MIECCTGDGSWKYYARYSDPSGWRVLCKGDGDPWFLLWMVVLEALDGPPEREPAGGAV